MILFHSETSFNIKNKSIYKKWIKVCIRSQKKKIGAINYIFCDNAYLLKINQEYLNHDTYTDIISFDYSDETKLSGDIFISIESVKQNAETFSSSFKNELDRVLIHGILHFIGFKDKSKEDKKEMRRQEDYYLSLRTF